MFKDRDSFKLSRLCAAGMPKTQNVNVNRTKAYPMRNRTNFYTSYVVNLQMISQNASHILITIMDDPSLPF